MIGRTKSFALSIFLFLTPIARGQSVATTSATAPRDEQAVALAQASWSALAGTTTINDISLTGSATYIAGSDEETGPLTLLASGNLQSRIALILPTGQRTEIRSGPAGNWIGPDGVEYPMALHNCMWDADWFYPGLSFQALSTDRSLGLSYVGPESRNGVAAYHLRLFRVISGQTADVTSQLQALSTEDIYLDAASILPLFLDFNIHPDKDSTLNLPVEIAFGAYKQMSGITVPTRIQKFVQNTLVLDATISSAAVNSGLPGSDFAVTASIAPLPPRRPPVVAASARPARTRRRQRQKRHVSTTGGGQ